MINYMSEEKENEFLDRLYDLDITCEEDTDMIDNLLKEYSIVDFEYIIEKAFDSTGYEVYYYAYSFIINDKPKLFYGTYDYC